MEPSSIFDPGAGVMVWSRFNANMLMQHSALALACIAGTYLPRQSQMVWKQNPDSLKAVVLAATQSSCAIRHTLLIRSKPFVKTGLFCTQVMIDFA